MIYTTGEMTSSEPPSPKALPDNCPPNIGPNSTNVTEGAHEGNSDQERKCPKQFYSDAEPASPESSKEGRNAGEPHAQQTHQKEEQGTVCNQPTVESDTEWKDAPIEPKESRQRTEVVGTLRHPISSVTPAPTFPPPSPDSTMRS